MRGSKCTKLRILLLLTVLWMGLIFWFSSRTSTESSTFSKGLLNAVLQIVMPHWEQRSAAEKKEIIRSLHTVFRKLGHFSEFSVLGLLLTLTVRQFPNRYPNRRQKHPAIRAYALPALLALLYACTDEFHQRFVAGRSCELRDVCIDTAGACCGILFCMLLLQLWRKLRAIRKKKAVSPTDS